MSNIVIISTACLLIICTTLLLWLISAIVIWVKTGSFVKGITWVFRDNEN